MRRLLLGFKKHVMSGLRCLVFISLFVLGVFSGVLHKERSGPNECSDDPVNPCCPGWQIAPTSGLCLQAVCEEGCWPGYCIGANLCRCPDGRLGSTCPRAEPSVLDTSEVNYDGLGRDHPLDSGPGDRVTCEDLPCQHRCDIIQGHPECSCMAGYSLDENGLTCSDVNECDFYAHICSHGCQNTDGGFVCVCHPGYALHRDGRRCVPLTTEQHSSDKLSQRVPQDLKKQPRRYINDMLDPDKQWTDPPQITTPYPSLDIQARVRVRQHKQHPRPLDQPKTAEDPTGYDSQRPVPRAYQSSYDSTDEVDHQYPPLPREGLDPYNLPSQFNPQSRYEQLPPDLIKQVFGKYDRKKLVPFDFDDRENKKSSAQRPPTFGDPESRAIFWEEAPTGMIDPLDNPMPCGGPDYPCPDNQAVYTSTQTERTPHQARSPRTRPPEVRTTQKQAVSDYSQPHIGQLKIKARKVSKQKHRLGLKDRIKKKLLKKFKTRESIKTENVTRGTNENATTTFHNDLELLQKDGKACRGDLCLFPDELEEVDIPTVESVKTDEFGQCPFGFEAVIINDYEVCKPLPVTPNPEKSVKGRSNQKGNQSTVQEHSAVHENGLYAGEVEGSDNTKSLNQPESTLPPFINFCVKEGKIMIITAQGIMCKNKAEENIFVNCQESEVYVETIAGYICRDPSTEDVLATPIQCPVGHSVIKTNTGYECRGTVTLQSSCPENYVTVESMSGTVCSPSAPLSPPVGEVCQPGESVTETEDGIQCREIRDELSAATGTISKQYLSTPDEVNVTGDPTGLPPNPELRVNLSMSEVVNSGLVCPAGQIAVQSATGSQCKYYTKLQTGRGDLPPSCPEGQTIMNSRSGLLCIGSSVLIEGIETSIHYESETDIFTPTPTTSKCPDNQMVVKTVNGEECQDIRPVVLPTGKTLQVENVCPEGQVAVNTTQGSECQWIGLERIPEPHTVCPEGSSLRQTNFGLLCINHTTGEPVIDSSISCQSGQVALLTPTGSICRSEGAIVGKIITLTDLDLLTSEDGCGLTHLIFQTLAGPLCLDKDTREPVFDEDTDCPDTELGVLTPEGSLCFLKSDIFPYTLSGSSCSVGLTVTGEEGVSICVDKDSKQPIIDVSVSCKDGKDPVLMPSGTFCMSKSSLKMFKQTEVNNVNICAVGQKVLETAAGMICIHAETLMPIVDETLSCLSGHAPIVTPSGTQCKLRSAILTKMYTSPPVCSEGQKVLNTTVGEICIHSETLEPVIVDTLSCRDKQVAVVTPSGILCKLRSAILTRLSKDPDESSEDSTDLSTCSQGQTVLETAVGEICIDSETLQPVIVDTLSCPGNQVAVLTPSGIVCTLQATTLTQLTKSPDQTQGLSTENPGNLFCSEGQSVLETSVGLICMSSDTWLPVVDEGVKCRDELIAVVTPSGTLCMLPSAILARRTDHHMQTEESTPYAGTTTTSSTPCGVDQIVKETEAGLICMFGESLQPVIDEHMACPEGQVPVVSPSGTFCMLRAVVFGVKSKISRDKTQHTTESTLSETCQTGQLVFETEAGLICLYEDTKQPVVDESVTCSDGQLPVVATSGTFCMLQGVIYAKLTETFGNSILTSTVVTPTACPSGQIIQETEVGSICVNQDTLEPVIDSGKTCSDGQIPVVTPSGSLCKLQSAILTRLSKTPEEDNKVSPSVTVRAGCGAGQEVIQTDIGPVCIYSETLEPVLNDTVSCPENLLPVLTPSETVCMLRSLMAGKLSNIPKSTQENFTSPSGTEPCKHGQEITETEFGPICIYIDTKQPVLDKSTVCKKSRQAVITPRGPVCVSNSSPIFGHVSHSQCSIGESSYLRKSFEICVYPDTGKPVIDQNHPCPKSKVGVLTPAGVICKSRSTVFGKRSGSRKATTAAAPDGLECQAGQVKVQFGDSFVCRQEEDIHTLTQTTAQTSRVGEYDFAEGLFRCSDGSQPYSTTSGLVCVDGTAPKKVIDLKTSTQSIAEESTVKELDTDESFLRCSDGSRPYSTNSGLICVNGESPEPVIDTSVFCPDGKVAIRTPSGTSCRSRERVRLSNIETTTQTVVDKSTMAELDLNQNLFICRDGRQPQLTSSGLVCRNGEAPAKLAYSPTTTPITETTMVKPECRDGHFMGQSEIGPICIHRESLEPVLDKTLNCPSEEAAVVTPTGSRCIPQSVVYEIPESVTPVSQSTPLTRPVCARGMVPVLKNGRYVCGHISVKKSDIPEPLQSTISPSQASVVLCNEGQRVHLSILGEICVHEETLQPLVDTSMSCPREQVAVFTPSGSVCKLRAAVFRYDGIPTDSPEKSHTRRDYECPVGQVAVTQNGEVVCKTDDTKEDLDNDCPPGYEKVQEEGVEDYGCQYVGFGKEKEEPPGQKSQERNEKPEGRTCPDGLVLVHTPEGPDCRYPFRQPETTHSPQTRPEDLDKNYRPPVLTGARQPCAPGTDCSGYVTRGHSIPEPNLIGPQLPCGGSCPGAVPNRQVAPCMGGVHCQHPGPRLNGQSVPCAQGVNCANPVVRTPGLGLGCPNGIQVVNGQPCGSPAMGQFPVNVPCAGGGNCGNSGLPVSPCQSGGCGGLPPSHTGCGLGQGNGCGSPIRPSYPFAVKQSCHNGFQPYRRGTVYMCIPINALRICQNNLFLKSLLGQQRCSGINHAVPSRRVITPCILGPRNPVTGRLSSSCEPQSDLEPVEDSEEICQNGEQLFRSSNGKTVCLPTISSSASQAQQEASPVCGRGERLTRTSSGYVCQRVSECYPPCASGGTCENGVCICPRGLSGKSCETDIDECKRLPARYCHYKCVNNFGSFACVCPSGYTLNADRRTCKPVPCTPDCRNGGSCVGGRCRCPPGFTGNACEIGQSCVPGCQNGATCRGRKCFCAPGYYGVNCEQDIDECYHFHPCDHVCQNSRGSYRCTCHSGYTLAPDGHQCVREDRRGRRHDPRHHNTPRQRHRHRRSHTGRTRS